MFKWEQNYMYIFLNKQNSIEIFSFDLNFFTECSLGTIIPKYLHWKEGNHMFMYLNMQAFKKKISYAWIWEIYTCKTKNSSEISRTSFFFFCYPSFSLSKVSTIHNEKYYYDLRIPWHIFILIFQVFDGSQRGSFLH